MKNNDQPQIEVTIEIHKMTKEEIKQSKIERKRQEKIHRQERKQKRRKAADLKKNFRTMDSCMIHPTNIKIGSLEKCIYSRVINECFGIGIGFGQIDEKLEPIDGQKVFIQIKPTSNLFVDLDQINSNKDLREIRKKINLDGSITLGGKILDCFTGKIRVDRKSLHTHPYFEENNIDTLVSVKQLKKIVEELRK